MLLRYVHCDTGFFPLCFRECKRDIGKKNVQYVFSRLIDPLYSIIIFANAIFLDR